MKVRTNRQKHQVLKKTSATHNTQPNSPPTRIAKKYMQKFSSRAGDDLALPGIDHIIVNNNNKSIKI